MLKQPLFPVIKKVKSNTNSITRSVKILQEEISYNLRYSKKAKYLRLQIKSGSGLELIVPRGYELKEAENFLIKKADWIKKHLKTTTGEDRKFLLWGNEICVSQSFQLFIKKHKLNFSANELNITSPHGAKESIEKIYEAWLKHISKSYITNRAQDLADDLGFKINRITIRSQKTRWGSASARKNLSFNYRLMRYRKEVIDYVIIHELCHLIEMNHSKKFWMHVKKYCPDYLALRRELKSNF